MLENLSQTHSQVSTQAASAAATAVRCVHGLTQFKFFYIQMKT